MYNHSCMVITMIIIGLASNTGAISSHFSSVHTISHPIVFCPAGFVAQLHHHSFFFGGGGQALNSKEIFFDISSITYALQIYHIYSKLNAVIYSTADMRRHTLCSNNKCALVWSRICLGLVFWMEAEAYQP